MKTVQQAENYLELRAREYIQNNGYYGGKAQMKGGIVVGINYWKPSIDRVPMIQSET